MVLQYGIYAPDGKYIQGGLSRYNDLAARLAEGTIGLYVESNPEKIIFGSAVNVQKPQRQDMLIVIVEYLLTSPHAATAKDFFMHVRKELTDAGYIILGVGGNESFFQSFESDSLECQPNIDAPTQYLVGRLIAQKQAIATTNQLVCAVSLASRVLEIIDPVIHLEYRIAVGRNVISQKNPFDLCILPVKPYDQNFADIDSGTIEDPDQSFYQHFGSVLENKNIQNVLRSYQSCISSKGVLFEQINKSVLKKKNPDQRVTHLNTLERLKLSLPSEISIEDAVHAALYNRDTRYLECCFSDAFNIEDFEKCVYGLPAEKFRQFFDIAKPVLLKLDSSTGINILRQLSSYVGGLQRVEKELKDRYDPVPEWMPRADRRDDVSGTPGFQPTGKELQEQNVQVKGYAQQKVEYRVAEGYPSGKISKPKPWWKPSHTLQMLTIIMIVVVLAMAVYLWFFPSILESISGNNQPTPSPSPGFVALATPSPEGTPTQLVPDTPAIDSPSPTPPPEETPTQQVSDAPPIDSTLPTPSPEEMKLICKSEDGKVELFVDGLSPSRAAINEIKITSYVDDHEIPSLTNNSPWVPYGSYYVIEPWPRELSFSSKAQLVFVTNDTHPERFFVGYTMGIPYIWSKEAPTVENQNVTLSIDRTGIYALFTKNMSNNIAELGNVLD